MSSYCDACVYRVSESTGEQACPFNALYWHFLMRHRRQLEANPRLGMVYRTLERMPETRQQALWRRGEDLLARLAAEDGL
jgi:deoxyribodipyrimidine photolyase-related protein